MVKLKVKFKSWLTRQGCWAMIGLYGLSSGREVNCMRLNFRNSKLNFCEVIK